MSRGKYSPTVFGRKSVGSKDFLFNCYGKVPVEWTEEVKASGVEYDEKTMFGNYDKEGFDSYGYSAFDENGEYVGIGDGVDRKGYTEMDYLCMSQEEFEDLV